MKAAKSRKGKKTGSPRRANGAKKKLAAKKAAKS